MEKIVRISLMAKFHYIYFGLIKVKVTYTVGSLILTVNKWLYRDGT